MTRPCRSCLKQCNNGHLWMFHGSCVEPFNRIEPTGRELTWASLPSPSRDVVRLSARSPCALDCDLVEVCR